MKNKNRLTFQDSFCPRRAHSLVRGGKHVLNYKTLWHMWAQGTEGEGDPDSVGKGVGSRTASQNESLWMWVPKGELDE